MVEGGNMHEKYTYFEDIIYKINLLNNSLRLLESEGYEVSSYIDELDSIYYRISDSIKTNNYDPHIKNEILSEYYSLEERVFLMINKESIIPLTAIL
jgi:hypothetical protein